MIYKIALRRKLGEDANTAIVRVVIIKTASV